MIIPCAQFPSNSLVGAGSLNVTGLLALVAHSFGTDLLRAFAAQVADLTAWEERQRRRQIFLGPWERDSQL